MDHHGAQPRPESSEPERRTPPPDRFPMNITGPSLHLNGHTPEAGQRRALEPENLIAAYLERIRSQTQTLGNLIDTKCLERLAPGQFNIGLEVENFLIQTGSGAASHSCYPILERIRNSGDHSDSLTSEMGEKMIEFRSPALALTGAALSELDQILINANEQVRREASALGSTLLPAGTLPSEVRENLSLAHLSQNPGPQSRFLTCNNFAAETRQGRFDITVGSGEREVSMSLDSLMAAGGICSIQPHLQCDPMDFTKLFNISVAFAGQIMAPAVASPLVLGKYADAESRIALLEQAWARDRVFLPSYISHPLDPFVENCDGERFAPIFYDSPAAGKNAHSLPELVIQNGTIHRWVRPVYGENDGKPHLRIEFRPLGTYPAPVDNVANAAWYWGVAVGMKFLLKNHGIDDVAALYPEKHARENFRRVAADGLDATIYDPFKADYVSAAEATMTLLKVAREGLRVIGIDEKHIEKYLGIIEARVTTRMTLSSWIVQSLDQMSSSGLENGDNLTDQQQIALTLAAAAEQNIPIHKLPLASRA